MKKWMYLFSVFFVMAFAVLISENTAFAQDRTDFNIQDGDLTKYAGTVANVEIPDDVVTIGENVFKNRKDIISVVIPQGVTTIEKGAFYGCTRLQSVVLPDSVTYLGEQAFSECKSLSSVTISKGLTSISKQAFCNCSKLLSISIPGSCTSIKSYAFSGCTNMGSIELGYGIQDIGEKAFYKNNKVVSVVIPDSVTNIEKYAFANCENLQDITLSKSLTILPSNIFYYCKKIKKLSIPEGVQNLEKGILYACSNLKYLAIPDSVTSIEKLSSSATPNKNLIIYCNRDTAAFHYAVNNDIFYKPLENYASDSAEGASSDTNTGTSTDSGSETTGGTTTDITNPGMTDGSDSGATSEVVTEVKVEEITCVNRTCIHVKFSNADQEYIDVAQMQEGFNNISFEHGGKIYNNIVNCTSPVLNVTSVKAVSDNEVVLTCSGEFAKDKNGLEIMPKFVVVGYTIENAFKQADGSIMLKLSGTTYEEVYYGLGAEYPEGIIHIQQNTFAGYKKTEETKPETDITDTTSDKPSSGAPVVDSGTSTETSTSGTTSDKPSSGAPVVDSGTSTETSTSGTTGDKPSSWDPVEDSVSSGHDVVVDSGTGWDDDFYEDEIIVKNPKLSKKTKTIKKGKTFTLYLKNTTSNAKWKTGNKKIAKIIYKTGKYVKIKALKKGSTNIMAYVNGKILRCKVKVK